MGRRFAAVWPPVLFGALFLLGWELFVEVFDIDEFLLPPPSAIFESLVDNWDVVRHGVWETGKIAVSGLAIGILAGVVLALVTTYSRALDQGLTPVAVALNATPIIALAPIFKAWFGITGMVSNQAVVVVVTFFPVFINTARGLTAVRPDEIELMRSYAASRWAVLRQVRLPTSLPFFLTALRVAAPLSVIAAIVAEYFGGPQDRIGTVITSNAAFARYDAAWAAIAAASALGLVLFAAVVVAERFLMPWRAGRTT
jgi:NitT/TauT family transport system permease protein